jgi:hypothetical protein
MVNVLSKFPRGGLSEVCLKVEVCGKVQDKHDKRCMYIIGKGIGIGSAPAAISVANLLLGGIPKGLIIPGPPLQWKLFEDGLSQRGFKIVKDSQE